MLILATMCGIAGVLANEPIDPAVVDTMLEAIAYRGPDNKDVQVHQGKGGVHLTVGQVRLAIMDPRPEANQPFRRRGGRGLLTFNGEFFNFRDLRQELSGLGYSFDTRSDTEVAATALEHWPVPEAVNRLWGMYAGCWFDPESGRTWLFRDRLGQKPLYLYQDGPRLYFASEPRAILAVLDHRPQPDPLAISYYGYLGYVPGHLCIYQGMRRLPPGHLLEINGHQAGDFTRWYHPEDEIPASEERLEELFLDATARRMIADVPLAAFLSGGLDSSLVVAAMRRMTDQEVNTFSVRFEGNQVLDESPYARMVAKHCGTRHHEVVLDLQTLQDALPRVLAHLDEPFGDSSAVPMWLVSREARKQFTVTLSGDGADEVFAGYRKYLGEHYLRRLGPYPLRRLLWRPLTGLLPTGRTSRLLETGRRVRRLLLGDGSDAAARHVRWLHMSPLPAGYLDGPALPPVADVIDQLRARLPRDADLNARLRFDQDLVLADDMFVKVDRMSMKEGLEVRSPFIDHRLVNLANALPPERKLAGTTRKRVLLERLGHMLPPEVLQRPKSGFEMPLGDWLRRPLANWTEDRLFHHADTGQWVDRAALKRVWQLHRSGRLDCTELLWYQIVFASWLRGIYS